MDNRRTTVGQPIDESVTIDRAPSTTGASLGDTVTEIIKDLQDIVRGEVQLAKTEVKEEASKMGKGIGMIAGAAIVALVGFIFLMLGVTYLLNKSLEMWMAAGIVGLALLIIGGIVAMVGKGRMDEANLVPEKTVESLKEDKEWASQQIKSVKK